MADTEAQYIEHSTLQYNGIDLDDMINEVADTADANVKDVNTMNRSRTVRGFKQGNVRYTLRVKAERLVDARVPDWHDLMKRGSYFKLIIRFNIGKPRTYGSCRVVSVGDSVTEGDSSQDITIRARTRKDG